MAWYATTPGIFKPMPNILLQLIVQMFSSVLIFRVRFRFLVEKDTSFEFIDTSYISEYYFKHVCKHLRHDIIKVDGGDRVPVPPLVFTMWLARLHALLGVRKKLRHVVTGR